MSWPLSVVSCCVYQASCLALMSPPSIILGMVVQVHVCLLCSLLVMLGS